MLFQRRLRWGHPLRVRIKNAIDEACFLSAWDKLSAFCVLYLVNDCAFIVTLCFNMFSIVSLLIFFYTERNDNSDEQNCRWQHNAAWCKKVLYYKKNYKQTTCKYYGCDFAYMWHSIVTIMFLYNFSRILFFFNFFAHIEV